MLREQFVPAEFDNKQTPQQRQAAIAIKGTDAERVGVPLTDTAPRIVAKGHGAVAEQILQLAFATGVERDAQPGAEAEDSGSTADDG